MPKHDTMRRPTLSDVAELLGVSVATVSQALSGKGRVAVATRQRILQAVEELAYHPDEAAKSLANRREPEILENGTPRTTRRKKQTMPDQVLFEVLDVGEISDLVAMEIQQRDEEGYDVASQREVFKAQTQWTKNRLRDLYLDLCAAPMRSPQGYEEPLGLAEIRECRDAGPRTANLVMTPSALQERVHGAWLGRCIGCVLGKPIESGWSRSKVASYLQLAGAYPLNDYIPRLLPHPTEYDMNVESAGFFRDEIDGVPCDDDLDYTILGLHILENHGLTFTTAQVASAWLGHLPYYRVYTAERIAYRNLTINIRPTEAAQLLNPARELVGARIRADVYGLVAPGRPQLAAELAYRDAVLSHSKNGVYSAMFMAAMLAWAYVTNDPREIVTVGLSEIPARSRLAEGLRTVLKLHEEQVDWESAYEELLLQYGSYHPVHAINNTLWVALALLFAGQRFDDAICTAVMCGQDTDCNGANVGAVAGLLTGASHIDRRWTAPLNDTLYTTIARWRERSIAEIARRTARLAAQTLEGH